MKSAFLRRCKHGLAGFSIEHLWCLTTLVCIWLFVSTHPIRPHDFWWHIRAGQDIVNTGQIPALDTFSFTAAGRPYVYWVYWLMETNLYLLYALGGPALVIFAHSLTLTITYGLMMVLCQRLSGSWRTAAVCTLFAAALGFNDWNVRPQTITFLVGALFLTVIYAARRRVRPDWLVLLPASMLVWVNSHGSFPLGLWLISLWFIEAAWRPGGPSRSLTTLYAPGASLVMTGLACLLNPQGIRIILYLASMGKNSVIQNLVPEWAPPSFDSLHGSFFLAGLLLCASILALSPRRPGLFQLLTFLSFAALGLKTARGGAWFGLVMAPILAECLPGLMQQVRSFAQGRNHALVEADSGTASLAGPGPITPRPGSKAALNYLLAGFMLVGVVSSLPWFKSSLPLPPEKAGLLSTETPQAATEFLLEAQPPGRLFHDMAFGSYLIWAAQPAYPVFVDPRIDLYPSQIWLDYLTIGQAGCGWERLLDHYGINSLMLDPRQQSALLKAVTVLPDWQQIYADDYAVILVRAGFRQQSSRPPASGRPESTARCESPGCLAR